MLLGVSDLYVYGSYILNKNATNLSEDLTKLVVPKLLFILFINSKSEEFINKLNEKIKELEIRVIQGNNNINSLKADNIIKQNKKAKIKSSIVITDLSDKTKKSIDTYKNLILELEKEILTHKSTISELKIILGNLDNLEYNKL